LAWSSVPCRPCSAPGHRGLDRLRLARKLVLIALVLIAPALYATWQFRSQQNARSPSAAKERVGVEEIVPAQRLLHRARHAPRAGRPRRRRRRRGGAALPAARKSVSARGAAMDAPTAAWAPARTDAMWKRLRARSRPPCRRARPATPRTLAAYDRLTAATRELIVQAGNASNLILDPTSTPTTRWTRWSTRRRSRCDTPRA
jgi:hypothetical protein